MVSNKPAVKKWKIATRLKGMKMSHNCIIQMESPHRRTKPATGEE